MAGRQTSFIFIFIHLVMICIFQAAHCKGILGHTKIECFNEDPQTIKSVSCNLTDIGARMNFNFCTLVDIKDAMVDISFVVNGQREFLNISRNLCTFLSKPMKTAMWEYFAANAFRKGHFVQKCPIKKDVVYSIENHLEDGANVPNIIPSLNFTISVRLHKKGRRGALFIIDGFYLKN